MRHDRRSNAVPRPRRGHRWNRGTALWVVVGLLAALPGLLSPAQAVPVRALTVGQVERLTVDNPNDVWSSGTLVVAGQAIVLPRNLLIDLPANRLTLQQLFTGAPAACRVTGESGLARRDACNTSGSAATATVAANRLDSGLVIAGDLFVQKGVELVSGAVTAVDVNDGFFRVNGLPADPASGVLVRMNDPTGRHSTQKGVGCEAGAPNCSPDPRFTLDPDNYTTAFNTGYPVCLPTTVPRTFTDVLDFNLNGNTTEVLTAVASPNGKGDILCPDTNRASLIATDSRRMAPVQVGDPVTVQGNIETIGTTTFLSAWNTRVGLAMSTSGQAGQPDYMTLDVNAIDAPGFEINRARALFTGFTTAPVPDVLLWSVHRDPTNNAAHEFPLGTTAGCNAVAAGVCNIGIGMFKITYDVDFLAGGAAKPRLNPCAHLRADPHFAALGVCPLGGTIEEQFSVLSPLPRELQGRTNRKMLDVAQAVPVLRTLDVAGHEAANGQYLFPLGIGLGGISIVNFLEINLNRTANPYIFEGLPWALDRRLSPGGCGGICESVRQPLSPFPGSGLDPRTQANVPTRPYSDHVYTNSTLSSTRDRILSFVDAKVANFDGDKTLLSLPALDAVPPTMPTGLTATAVTPSRIDVSWTASTDNVAVTGYRLFRDGAPLPLATVTTGTSFVDDPLPAASTHTYAAEAFDTAGNLSVRTPLVSATTLGGAAPPPPPPPPPPPLPPLPPVPPVPPLPPVPPVPVVVADIVPPTQPANVSAVVAGPSTIAVTWSPSTDNVGVTGYRVLREDLVAPLATVTGTSFNDTGLPPSTLHFYNVQAVDAAGNLSPVSAVSGAMTPAPVVVPLPAPPAPAPPSPPAPPAPPVIPARGYRVAAADGRVTTANVAGQLTSAPMALTRPVVGIASTPSGNGHWLVASDGGVFTFGDGRFFGSTGSLTLNRPIVGMAPTPTGNGYWLVASDGGVFSFGDAAFLGSTGGITLNRPIVGMTATPSGNGYWLVASDGGIFAFGDARFLGSTGGIALNSPITGMAATPTGNGYWMVASDGGIFAFGDARFFGSAATSGVGTSVGMARTASGNGYWITTSLGQVLAFGDATPLGAGPAPAVGIAG